MACSSTKTPPFNQHPHPEQIYLTSSQSADSATAIKSIDAILASEPPILIGGLSSLKIRYPERARERSVQGRVIVQFVVDVEGKAKKIKIIKGIGHGCDGAARNAIRKAKFIPGKDADGNVMSTIMTLPINFYLGM